MIKDAVVVVKRVRSEIIYLFQLNVTSESFMSSLDKRSRTVFSMKTHNLSVVSRRDGVSGKVPMLRCKFIKDLNGEKQLGDKSKFLKLSARKDSSSKDGRNQLSNLRIAQDLLENSNLRISGIAQAPLTASNANAHDGTVQLSHLRNSSFRFSGSQYISTLKSDSLFEPHVPTKQELKGLWIKPTEFYQDDALENSDFSLKDISVLMKKKGQVKSRFNPGKFIVKRMG